MGHGPGIVNGPGGAGAKEGVGEDSSTGAWDGQEPGIGRSLG